MKENHNHKRVPSQSLIYKVFPKKSVQLPYSTKESDHSRKAISDTRNEGAIEWWGQNTLFSRAVWEWMTETEVGYEHNFCDTKIRSHAWWVCYHFFM